jgi:TonB family protein
VRSALFTVTLLLVAAFASQAGAAPQLTKPPKLVRFVEAAYPPEEKAAGRQATVVLRLTIGVDGVVSEVAVETTAGAAFDAAALAAARQFMFEPAEIDGKPAAIRILYKYEFTITREARTTGDVTGVVRNRKTKKPLAGIALGVGGKTAVTGADGRFALRDLQPGRQAISLSGPEITALRTEETVEADKATDVVYDVTPEEKVDPADKDDLEIVVVAPPLQKQVASVTVAADQGRRVPGTQGDVLKVVESLPGVARAATGSGALVVWGAAPQDTRVYVDGVRLPTLYHTGGVRSVFAGDLVRSIELVPGGYGATYGRGLGGIVVVATAPLEGDGVHGAVAADVIDASAVVRAKLAPRLRTALAFRHSYLDKTFGAATDRDVGDLFPIPRYNDGQLRLAYELGKDEHVEVAGLLSNDEVARTVATSDPSSTRRDVRDISFNRIWARYRRTLADGSPVDVVAFFGTDSTSLLNQFGGPESRLSTDSTLYGLRGSWRGRLSRHFTLGLGVDTEVVTSRLRRQGSITVPAREGDVRAFGQLPPEQENNDAWRTAAGSVAPYAELELSLFGDRLRVLPGLRVEPFVTSTSQRTPSANNIPPVGIVREENTVQPRLTMRWAATSRLAVTGSWGRYVQAPQAEDLSAVFGNPTLPLQRATHAVLGFAVKLTEKLGADLTLFHTSSSGLAARSPLETPVLAEALVPLGEGRTIGGQIVVRRELSDRLFGWVSYSLLKAERWDPVVDPNAPVGPTPTFTLKKRLFDYDQTHLLTVVGSYDLGRGFEVGVRVRYATGFPRTPVVGALPDARSGTYQPQFGAQNSVRLPAFFQSDVRFAKRFRFEGQSLEISLDLQNVTYRANVEEYAYSLDYSTRSAITGLPFLPVLGARYTF